MRTRWLDAAFLALCAGLVFLWFQPGHLILAEDIRVPYQPAQWPDHLHAWDAQINTGSDYNIGDFPGLLHHGAEAALQWLGVPMATAQRLLFFAWFLLPGLGMYYMMGAFVHGPGARAARLLAANFYMFNLHLEPIWLLKDVATLSAYATFPWAIRLFVEGCQQAERRRRSLLWLGLVFVVGSGTGVNPPVQLIAATVLPLYLSFWLATARWRRRPTPQGALMFGGQVAALWLGINAFWLIPVAMKTGQYTATGIAATAQSVSLDWLRGVSANTNWMNVIRFQGHWTWYEGWQEPYHTYATLYHTQPLLLGLSWVAPAFVLIGLVTVRHTHHLFFMLLTAIGVTLGLGTHAPMTSIYLWCVKHVPLFWTIRGPYYKFGLLAILGYAFFIGLVGRQWYLACRARAGVAAAGAVLLTLMLVNMVYAFPVTIGRMYATQAERKFLPPNHVRIPPHVWAAARWLDQQSMGEFFRVLTVPEVETWFYEWGLAAGRPALVQVGRTPMLYRMANPLVPTSEQTLLRAFYRALYEGQTPRLGLITRLLNAKYLLHETDLKYWVPTQDMDDPPFIRRRLAWQPAFVQNRAFGPWEFRAVPPPLPHLYLLPQATLIAGAPADLIPLTMTELLETPACLFTSEIAPQELSALDRANALDSVVVTPGAALPPNLTLPAHRTVIVTPGHLTPGLDAHETTRLVWEQGFDPPWPHPDGRRWQDLMANGSPVVTLTNPSPESTTVGMHGTVAAYDIRRNLYVYLNGNLVGIRPIAPGAPVPVFLHPLTLRPGANTIAFYAPEARTQLPDGRQVNFQFAEDWAIGPLAYEGTVVIPSTGRWVATLAAGPSISPGTPLPVIQVADTLCSWSADPSHPEAEMTLSAGPATVQISHLREAAYTLLLRPAGQPPLPPRTLRPVAPLRASPTRYLLPPIEGPGLLVFSEGYHPGWQAKRGGSSLQHVPMQGFANGYWVPPGPAAAITLEFQPQRWFVWGALVSAGTLLALAGIARGMDKRKWIP